MKQVPERLAVAPIEGSRLRERLRTVVVPDHDDLAALLADRIVEVIHHETATKGRCVLGLATGSTPLGIYQELIRRHRAGEVDFSHVVTFNLDEYYPMPPASPHSYRRYMQENLFDHVNLPAAQAHVPDGGTPREQIAQACAAYERAIADAGGIDFQLLGIGQSGHIGFNEPGSTRESRTRLVTLDTITRRAAAADFFGEDNVPREAITMGVATILEAREIALIATGEHKAAIVRRAVEGEPSHDVAATFLQGHPNATGYLDLAAAAELTRIKTPWVLESVTWTPALTERALVWLSEQAGKAILKLTAQDYAEHHLSPLLARSGAPGPINGEVFNRLRDKIRGRARLPTRNRILVFSPHPDDDVISMGGILRKLWENENAITVAYMTSGNIAVFDHDVRRHLEFTERAATTLGVDPAAVRRGPAVLSHRGGAQAPHRRRGRRDRRPAARGGPPRLRLRRRRPLRSPRHPPHVQAGGGPRPGRAARPPPGGVAVPRGVAGMVDHRSRRAGAAVAGRAARQDPRDLQAPVPEGHRAVPRGARRPRVLAARRGAQPRDRRAC